MLRVYVPSRDAHRGGRIVRKPRFLFSVDVSRGRVLKLYDDGRSLQQPDHANAVDRACGNTIGGIDDQTNLISLFRFKPGDEGILYRS